MKKVWTLLSMVVALLVAQNLSAQDYDGNWPDGRFGSGQGFGGSYHDNLDSASGAPRAQSADQAAAAQRNENFRTNQRLTGDARKEFGELQSKYIRVHGQKDWERFGKYESLDKLRQHLAGYPSALYPDPKLTQHGAPPYDYVTSEDNKKRWAEINANRGEYDELSRRYIRANGMERWTKIGGMMTLGELRNAAKYFSVAAVVSAAIGVAAPDVQAASVRFDPNSNGGETSVSLEGSNIGKRNPVLSQPPNQAQGKSTNSVPTSR